MNRHRLCVIVYITAETTLKIVDTCTNLKSSHSQLVHSIEKKQIRIRLFKNVILSESAIYRYIASSL